MGMRVEGWELGIRVWGWGRRQGVRGQLWVQGAVLCVREHAGCRAWDAMLELRVQCLRLEVGVWCQGLRVCGARLRVQVAL